MQRIQSDKAPPVKTGYAQAIEFGRAKRTLLVSGQIPVDVEGTVPAGFDAQCRLVWRNIFAQLDAAGMTIANIAKVTIFLSSREYAVPNRTIRMEMLGDHEPALTCIITGIFDEAWLLEIEALAIEEA
ncbi:MAG: RidA family protein [Hyphomicrobiales bacterium]|nr:RidA family protein [Hyphomicrobiales bacterium]